MGSVASRNSQSPSASSHSQQDAVTDNTHVSAGAPHLTRTGAGTHRGGKPVLRKTVILSAVRTSKRSKHPPASLRRTGLAGKATATESGVSEIT